MEIGPLTGVGSAPGKGGGVNHLGPSSELLYFRRLSTFYRCDLLSPAPHLHALQCTKYEFRSRNASKKGKIGKSKI